MAISYQLDSMYGGSSGQTNPWTMAATQKTAAPSGDPYGTMQGMGATGLPPPMPSADGFQPVGWENSYGTVDKYFTDVLKKAGYSGSVLGANPDFLSYSGGDGDSIPDATLMDPAFKAWAEANGISTSAYRGDDYAIMRLLQGDNVLGEQRYTTKSGLDKFAEIAVPAAIAVGTGGVLGQAFGLIPPTFNPLDPLTWGASGAGGATGVPFELGNMGPVTPFTPPPIGMPFDSLANIPRAITAPAEGAFFDAAVPSLSSMGLETAAGVPSWLKNVVTTGAITNAAKSGVKDIVKSATKPDGSPGPQTPGGGGGADWNDILGSLLGLYQGNRYQDSVMDLYKSLDQQFAPGSAYEQQMRQQLDRRDAAAGRRSQYGPREVELQAKLAEMRGNQATTLAGLLDKSNAGLDTMLKSGITLGKDTGFTDFIGKGLGKIGESIWKDLGIEDTEWWQELFGD